MGRKINFKILFGILFPDERMNMKKMPQGVLFTISSALDVLECEAQNMGKDDSGDLPLLKEIEDARNWLYKNAPLKIKKENI